MSKTSMSAFLITTAILLLVAAPASAASHLWRFNEFYSSPDGTIQFMEMQEINGSDVEVHLADRWFKTNTYNQDQSQLLGSNLELPTAYQRFLVGSESYAALPGVPQPDYIFPDGFLTPSGDTVVWWFYQTIEIPPGVMPTDGVHSITVDDPDIPTYTVGVNSPRNLAGDTGTVVLPTGLPSYGQWGLPLGLALLAVGAVSIASRRRRQASSTATR